jgi:hypothetical protein
MISQMITWIARQIHDLHIQNILEGLELSFCTIPKYEIFIPLYNTCEKSYAVTLLKLKLHVPVVILKIIHSEANLFVFCYSSPLE